MSKTAEFTVEKLFTILSVGEVRDVHQPSLNLPNNALLTKANIGDIDSRFIAKVQPNIVVSCLVCRDFDFLELAQALQIANYQGELSIIVPELPNPGIVLAEATTACPDLRITFISENPAPNRLINLH